MEIAPGTVVFDIETDGGPLLPARPGFIRLVGLQTGDRITMTTDAAAAAQVLREAHLIAGHNIMSYDLLAFAAAHDLDLHELTAADRVIDTMLTEVLINPPVPVDGKRRKPEQLMRDYALDRLGEAKFGAGKTGDLKALAREWGGYGSIPADDERYLSYCAGDVALTARLGRSQARTPYTRREHRVAAVAAQLTLNGFRVDTAELSRRIAAGAERREQQKARLFALGMPEVNGQGKPVTYPHRTKEGRELLARLLAGLGVEPRMTANGENIATDSDTLAEMCEQYADRPEVLDVLEPIQALNGVRTVYETVAQYLAGDRVHPQVQMVQASGRWSITKPGLTVFGKRGQRWREREIFLPEPGHVIIAADLAQIDARAVAAWCQDPGYLGLFEPGRDSHTEIALAVWGDAGRRQDAKVIGHGWNYGMGLRRLAEACGDEDAAREFDAAMRRQFPGLVAWKDAVRAQAAEGPLDNGFGRLMVCEPGWEYTQAPALMGQGTARDLMMHGLLRLPRHLLTGLRAVVHDEVVLSVPEADADACEAALLDALSFEWAPRDGDRPVRIEAGLAGPRAASWGAVYAH